MYAIVQTRAARRGPVVMDGGGKRGGGGGSGTAPDRYRQPPARVLLLLRTHGVCGSGMMLRIRQQGASARARRGEKGSMPIQDGDVGGELCPHRLVMVVRQPRDGRGRWPTTASDAFQGLAVTDLFEP